MRIYRKEIIRDDRNVHFSRLNRHHKDPTDMSWSFVVEYQFARLFFDYDYQPLLMALKGFQLAANPYPLQDCRDCPYQDYHREIERMLIHWASNPTPVSQKTIHDFMDLVTMGLDQEAALIGQEYGRYAQRMLGKIKKQLHQRNKRIQQYHARRQRTAHHSN